MDFDISNFRALADKKRLDNEAALRQKEEKRALVLTENGKWFVDKVFNAVLDHLNTNHDYSGTAHVNPEERDFRDWLALTDAVSARFVALGFDVLNLRVVSSECHHNRYEECSISTLCSSK